ncbi:MAG TPA: glycosyl transferase family 1, partial [Calditrichia bacterium]|nr:glycosyl transferase family 1 [Calditrichia bacterium]
MKKALIITYYWPPAGGPGVQRVLRFVRYLVRMNWQPIIMTVQDGDYPAVDESLVEQIPPECVVYRTPVAEPYQLYRRFTGKKKDEKLPTYILSKKKNEGITDRVARWVRGNIFVPDARI